MDFTGIRDALWGAHAVFVLLAFGVYFTVRLKLYRPSFLFYAFGSTFFKGGNKGNGGNISSFSALSTALGGTVGVGSISGVALAISVGGAGSIFWMWLCSFLGMGLKYAEVAVAHSKRRITPRGYAGGAMYCLESLGYKKCAYVFAVLCAISAFAGGSVVQAGAVSGVMSEVISSARLRAVIIGAVTLLIISGGRKRIAKVNAVALPIASGAFILAALGVLIAHIENIPEAIAMIFEEALGLRSAAGGISGAAMIRVGCTRGTFSHEAGMGSAPISYAASVEENSNTQGLWGVTEVFIDSFVVSTLTALCLLCTDTTEPQAFFGNCYGDWGLVLYSAALGIFAIAAIISWCFYGEEAVAFISHGSNGGFGIFRCLVAFGAAAGALLNESNAFAAADIWGALMLFPNLFLLYKTRSDIIALAKQKG